MDQDAPTSMDEDDRLAARREEALVDADLVDRARSGDPDAFGILYERWFERVHNLAFRITRDSSVAPEVAQEAFISAWRTLDGIENTAAFGGWLLRITRNAALNRRRKEIRSSPRDSEGMAVIESVEARRPDSPAGFRVEDRMERADDPVRAVEDNEMIALVWGAAEALGERDAEVLDLTLRYGLTPAEIGEVIGVNRNAANQTVHRVRNRLKTAVQARVLWRGGEPVCGDLADALGTESVTRFGPDAVRIASAHAETCDQCSRRRALRLEPSAMFAATPFLVIPLLKQQIAHALSAEGVPMGATASGASAVPNPSATGAESPHRPRWRSRVVAVVAAAIVGVVALGILAESIDEASAPERRAAAPANSTTATSTTATTAITPALEPVTPTTGPRFVPPPAPAVTGSISIEPSASSVPTFLQPALSWSVSNAVTVQVAGPGFLSASPSGTARVCPGASSGPGCTAAPGSYTYTVRGFDASGAPVFVASAIFSVG